MIKFVWFRAFIQHRYVLQIFDIFNENNMVVKPAPVFLIEYLIFYIGFTLLPEYLQMNTSHDRRGW